MPFKKGHKFGHGGARRGSGPKPKPETVLKRIEQEKRILLAQEAFEFEVQLMRDPSTPKGIAMACAQDIQDRVFGKPKQGVEHSGTVTLEQLIIDSQANA